jgi:nicotinamidase-related amidase
VGPREATALLVMDAQTVIVERAPESFFVAMRRAIDAAHEADIQVIYIRVRRGSRSIPCSPPRSGTSS